MAYVWDLENSETYKNRYGAYKFRNQYEFIVQNFKNRTSVLDIAGGSGRFALPLFELCHDITVVDLNEEALALLKSRNSQIKQIQGDFMEIELDRTYTFLLCIEALSYFIDYDSYFKKIAALLESDGNFVFLMVNPESWRFKARKFNKDKTEYDEITLSEMKYVIEKNGLVIESMQGFNWIPLPIRLSDSVWVSIFAFLEKMTGVGKYHSQSPWLMVSVKKNQGIC